MPSKCNRCGKEFEYNSFGYNDNSRTFEIKKYSRSGNKSGWKTIKLCPKCYAKLKKFLYYKTDNDYDNGMLDSEYGGCDEGGY